MGNQIHSICELLRHPLRKSCPRAGLPIESRCDSRLRWTAVSAVLPTVQLTGAALFLSAFLIPSAFLFPEMLSAQSAAAPTAHATAKPATHASSTDRKRSTAHRRSAVHPVKAAVASAQTAPAAPPKLQWPIDQPPNPATVTWDSQGLSIEASNSSLDQILQEITVDTGVKLQGLNHDERIYGNYGPGPAREVLSKLLDGSGYNVLMIGGSGDQPPLQIILSPSVPASSEPANRAQASSNDDENQADDQPQQLPEPPQPMPSRSPFGPGAQRVPLEMQQQMQIRQQQIEQQQGNTPQR